MGDIKSHKLLYLKGALFVVLGLLASINILVLLPTWEILLSLGLAIWAFSRAYYFAFYVIEHYIDESYKFAGLGSFFRYLWKKRSKA
ncbi:MAG: hypothetical protein KC800_01625 [Candidatus Eremiobacteraeota bacterium]|nr:hypothetical protein [Candidatus Eremiobacteraeota bacterium]